jgi:hypothetical protein
MPHAPLSNSSDNDDQPGSNASLGRAMPLDYFRPAPIYVPVKPWAQSPFGIVRGSAIVGFHAPSQADGMLAVYYEGNIYGDHYFSRFAIRCLHAHGRLAQRYPTVAKANLPLHSLTQVGVWHPREKVVELLDLDLLAEWCGWTLPVTSEELNAS